MKSVNGRAFRHRNSMPQGENATNILEFDVETLKEDIDAFFLIVMGCIVYFMQCGFALLEAGSVRYFFLLFMHN